MKKRIKIGNYIRSRRYTPSRRPDGRSLSTKGVAIGAVSALLVVTGVIYGQNGGGVGVADAVAPAVQPLATVGVPDVNGIGLLDRTGPNADAWPQITMPGNIVGLRALGKALFWDMQVGGDGVQACASCHYHAGADNRKTHQSSPGLNRRTTGGTVPAADTVHDLLGTNGTLTAAHFNGFDALGQPIGLPTSEAALIAAGATPDVADNDGTPGEPVALASKPEAAIDVDDVFSSQGARAGTFHNVNPGPPVNRQDSATLATEDGANGFTHDFLSNAPGVPDTVRRVEPRNSPTVINAVYNHRNFWDGRADAWFNGVNPFGSRDPEATVKAYVGGAIVDERLDIPFSSLASQAVGPIGSSFEMVIGDRPTQELGRKMSGATPLAGQLVACGDDLLGGLTDCTTPGTTNRGLSVAPAGTYDAWIKSMFAERFWGDGSGADVCLDGSGALIEGGCDGTEAYTLLEWNFALFFGLSVQAYEATLTTPDTIVDLINGFKVTGTLTNGTGRNARVVNTANLPLAGCIARLATNTSAAQAAIATNLCTAHYAKFIHPGATAGSQAATGPNQPVLFLAGAAPLTPGAPIGGCTPAPNCTVNPPQRRANAQATLLNIDRGLGRFLAGATGCAICHFNPEFTGATVQVVTGFGAAPLGPLPPGQVAREVEVPVAMERMIAFNGLAAVYDAGFYNLGVRPTPEDISLGGATGTNVPLSFAKLVEIANGGNPLTFDAGLVATIAARFANGEMLNPTSPSDLTPTPFFLDVACGAGLVNPNANNNPAVNCVPTVIPGERILRNGAFKAQGLRNVKFTGPYLHNGSKMNLQEVFNFYENAGHFPNLNLNNLDAGMRIFALTPADEAATIEMMETGLTDWTLAFEEDKFSHPEICVPHGHDPSTGETALVGIPAVGAGGNGTRLQTFEDQLAGDATFAHSLTEACTVPGISVGGLSTIEIPPAPAP